MQETYQRLGANQNCTMICFSHHPYVIGTVYRKKQEIRNRFPSLNRNLTLTKSDHRYIITMANEHSKFIIHAFD